MECETCKFFEKDDDYLTSGNGECHFLPPVMDPEHIAKSYFPTVYKHDWCSKYKMSEREDSDG